MALGARNRPRRSHRHPDAVRKLRALRGDPVRARHRHRVRARRCGRSRRAGRAGVRRGPGRRDHHREGPGPRTGGLARLAGRQAADPRRRVDHLHLGLDGHPEGRRRHAPECGGVRRRRGGDLPQGQPARDPATACSRGCRSPSTRRARRCGWRGDTGPAWCPRRVRWSAAAWTSGRGWCRATSPWCRRCRRSRRSGLRRHSRRSGF